MKKEKFLFELIDNYLYVACLGCMVMENYLLEDRTDDYAKCANVLDECMCFYDQLCEKVDSCNYSAEEVDVILNYMIQSLKQETVHTIYNGLTKSIKEYIDDAETFVTLNLLTDEYGKAQEVTEKSLKNFMKKLRDEEIKHRDIKKLFKVEEV